MNYQHAFHAGNFADVHKHVVLTRIVDYLRAKPAAFRVIDTHAGAGRYDLAGPEAARAGEWRNGIARVFPLRRSGAGAADNAQALLAPYLDIVASLNRDGELRLYPGSPLIAKSLLRSQDRLIACELEPRAATSLKAALRGDPRAKVLAIDGWVALNANVPPKERRGLVLIDPPYEESDDFHCLSAAFAQAHRKWPTGLYLLWYPIKTREAADALARRLRRLGVAKVMRCELSVGEPRPDSGLVGSGLILANPPYPLERELQILLPALTRLFGQGGSYRIDWLAGE
ncbi:MAG TPA: 23S rRNA (adenine(2030)-N(6))-methyltransferase RlmJ [Xanthobacteraceae bacterium]|nr:23S rRNA (adenine(2030)-N(6))-methyltransferase RlmJ [Xanthobacteraceae bacterium]